MSTARGALEAKKVKDQLREIGYTFTFSIYGILTDLETRQSEYRRIEILCNCTPDERIVELIYRFLQEHKPSAKYTIWVYDKDRDAIRLMFKV